MNLPAKLTSGLLLLLLSVTFFSCEEDVNPNYAEEAADPERYHRAVKQLTDVIVHDIFSPPVAARIYSYSNLAAYEVMAAGDPAYQSLAGQITEFAEAPQPEEGLEYSFPVAALVAQCKVGKSLIFSEDKITKFEEELMAEILDIRMPSAVLERSVAYGQSVADHVIAYYDGDLYKQTRTYPKFSISDERSRWQPTPPDYMDGIEPSWKDIRPFTLDSAGQYKPLPPTEYSEEKGSRWYEEVMEVYTALDEEMPDYKERTAIAQFWDCNPYVSNIEGHLMFASKKISPGGHWINIVALACRQAEADLPRSVEAYTLTSLALMDGFISCWDEKYRSALLRPETFINRHIDEEWRPLLQTPPFPEHTSGHSVISRAAAVVLTDLFGDDFAFDDTSEEEYGLPMRSFESFLAASEEAALSRLYGGIHYRPAIDYGVDQGENVGNHVLRTVETRAQITEQQ
ncbi:phosphatidic acid phosphatase [Lewinellaceae bacterium SD302]|nr:phosphatidic acid phosphatase [Lewinellaceae bacterium SD302]